MYTISRIARIFRLSRSTLLYYDSIGLLRPYGRSEKGYRLYCEEDRRRLEKIALFRGLGVPLEKIGGYLARPEEGTIPLLMSRMIAINGQMEALKDQQKAILEMIEAEGSLRNRKPLLHTLSALAAKAGITEKNYLAVHRTFEKASSEAHRRFLAYLGFTDAEIRALLRRLEK
jgi:DNA-binding transcriptional MerR regulator